MVRTYGLIFGGVAGLIFAFWRARIATRQAEAAAARADAAIDQARAANEQARIAEQGHITDRFSTAVEHLGSKELPIRLGGIYALWRLIKDSPERDVISVIDILCAFVRHPPHLPLDRPEPDTQQGGQGAAKDEANATIKLRPDVQAILKLIGDRDAVYRAHLPDGYRLDLKGADLREADLGEADLGGADLRDADLTGANLWQAYLTGAYLTGADLTRAHLKDAYLRGAKLLNVELKNTDLANTNLTDAVLAETYNLTQDQLDSACMQKGGKPPVLPEGLKPPQKECHVVVVIR